VVRFPANQAVAPSLVTFDPARLARDLRRSIRCGSINEARKSSPGTSASDCLLFILEA